MTGAGRSKVVGAHVPHHCATQFFFKNVTRFVSSHFGIVVPDPGVRRQKRIRIGSVEHVRIANRLPVIRHDELADFVIAKKAVLFRKRSRAAGTGCSGWGCWICIDFYRLQSPTLSVQRNTEVQLFRRQTMTEQMLHCIIDVVVIVLFFPWSLV